MASGGGGENGGGAIGGNSYSLLWYKMVTGISLNPSKKG